MCYYFHAIAGQTTIFFDVDVISACFADVSGGVLLIFAVVYFQFHAVISDTFAKKCWTRFSAVRQDTVPVVIGAIVAITAAVHIFAVLVIVDFAAILTCEIVIAVTVIAKCQRNSIDGKVAIAEEAAAMVAYKVFAINLTNESVVVVNNLSSFRTSPSQ